MASFNIHLAIAREYIKKHKDILNEEEFIRGSIAPDLARDKNKSHYTEAQDPKDLIKYLENKVSLEKFLKENQVDTDYKKGEFLHLLIDELFFNELINKEYLLTVDYQTFRKDLYYTYNITNLYLKTKYDTDYGIYKDEIEMAIGVSRKQAEYNLEDRINIIPFSDLDNFIETISNLDIDLYISNLIKKTQEQPENLKNVSYKEFKDNLKRQKKELEKAIHTLKTKKSKINNIINEKKESRKSLLEEKEELLEQIKFLNNYGLAPKIGDAPGDIELSDLLPSSDFLTSIIILNLCLFDTYLGIIFILVITGVVNYSKKILENLNKKAEIIDSNGHIENIQNKIYELEDLIKITKKEIEFNKNQANELDEYINKCQTTLNNLEYIEGFFATFYQHGIRIPLKSRKTETIPVTNAIRRFIKCKNRLNTGAFNVCYTHFTKEELVASNYDEFTLIKYLELAKESTKNEYGLVWLYQELVLSGLGQSINPDSNLYKANKQAYSEIKYILEKYGKEKAIAYEKENFLTNSNLKNRTEEDYRKLVLKMRRIHDIYK